MEEQQVSATNPENTVHDSHPVRWPGSPNNVDGTSQDHVLVLKVLGFVRRALGLVLRTKYLRV
eukprot:4514478-Pyramimonas_sp.AAC.1